MQHVRLTCDSKIESVPFEGGTLSKALDFTRGILGNTYLVVDNSNQFTSGNGRDFRVDFDATQQHLGGDNLVSAAISVSQAAWQRPSQDAFYRHLERTGWQVNRFGLLRSRTGELSENEMRVDGDVRKLIRSAANAADCDSIVVMSGDGGMTNAVKEARRAGKQVYVVAWEGTLNPALAAAATDYITIDELRPLIGRVLH